jgi:hypothetical protein
MIISVINMFMIALLLCETINAIFLYFKQMTWSFGVMIGLMGLTLLVTALVNFLDWYSNYRYIKYGKPVLIDCLITDSLLESAYMHPGMTKEEDDLLERLDAFSSGQGGNLTDLLSNPVEDAEREYIATAQKDNDFDPLPVEAVDYEDEEAGDPNN